MAQKRKRPTVSLTLDPEIRAQAMALLEDLPGKPSFSQLVDELVAEFVTRVGPMVEQMKAATAGHDVSEAVKRLLGAQMLAVGAEAGKVSEALDNLPRGPLPEPVDFGEAVRSTERAARAIQEGRKRKE